MQILRNLKDVANIQAGHPFRGKIPETTGAETRAVQMRDVTPFGGIDWDACIETNIPGKKDPDWLRPGDILFASRGSHNYAALVDTRLGNRRAVATPQFFVLRANPQEVIPGFLAFLLNQAPCQRHFLREAEGTGTKSIRRAVLEATPIAIPPLDKQMTILQLSTCVQARKEIAQGMIANGERLLTAVSNDLFNQHPTL